jgi:amidophosphoribosyltransferase
VGVGEGPNEACGLFGVWAPGEDVARLTFFGLFQLQHRGQESAGMAVSDGRSILVYRELGLVSQVFNEGTLSTLQGDLCIGHTRYSTTGSTTWENAQPVFKSNGSHGLALGHNGNLVNTAELAAAAGKRGRSTTDTDVVSSMLARHLADGGLEGAALRVLPQLKGAFSFVMLDERTLFACRDPQGLRPLGIGRLPGGGYCVASETCALDVVGATYVREVEPGELVAIDERGIRSLRFAESAPALCLFEFVYLGRADSRMYGRSLHEARKEMGRRLAREAPVDADMIVPVPDTAVSAAQGYAEASGIPYGDAMMKNRYIGRTFIEPTPMLRQRGVKLKLNPMPDAVRGRRLVVVDDSIVRGTTTRQLIQALREAGAAELHLRITSPPIRWPCFYGIDMSTRGELIAAGADVEGVREFVAADSLAYLSLDALVAATEAPKAAFCRACWDGEYPVPIPGGDRAPAKFALEPR